MIAEIVVLVLGICILRIGKSGILPSIGLVGWKNLGYFLIVVSIILILIKI